MPASVRPSHFTWWRLGRLYAVGQHHDPRPWMSTIDSFRVRLARHGVLRSSSARTGVRATLLRTELLRWIRRHRGVGATRRSRTRRRSRLVPVLPLASCATARIEAGERVVPVHRSRGVAIQLYVPVFGRPVAISSAASSRRPATRRGRPKRPSRLSCAVHVIVRMYPTSGVSLTVRRIHMDHRRRRASVNVAIRFVLAASSSRPVG